MGALILGRRQEKRLRMREGGCPDQVEVLGGQPAMLGLEAWAPVSSEHSSSALKASAAQNGSLLLEEGPGNEQSCFQGEEELEPR